MGLILLVLSIAPGLAIIWYIYNKDKYEREPKKYLIVCFLLGMISTLPAIVIQLFVQKYIGGITPWASVFFCAFFAFVVVALSEELSKFLMLRWYAYPKNSFNEPMDGIVYGVMVAMGFATLENVGYVYQNGVSTAVMRIFLSVPAHGAFGALMGYYTGLAKFNKKNAVGLLIKGLAAAVFFHGAFDVFLFLKENRLVKEYVGGGLLGLGALISYFFAVGFSLRAIRFHRALSRVKQEEEKKQLIEQTQL